MLGGHIRWVGDGGAALMACLLIKGRHSPAATPREVRPVGRVRQQLVHALFYQPNAGTLVAPITADRDRQDGPR
jgi:hypothetical protein